ncbi:hypothetical protein [Kitasatospora purpeofusca]|uniref:hypothetical protein n=1 Tax=Kitasatospora purpeofusca TaxID=67352 RepID=UPI003F4ABC7B
MTGAEEGAAVLYTWLITLQYPVPAGGFAVVTRTGQYPAYPGAGRATAYREIRALLARQDPACANASVLFFSLQPDRL